MGAVRNAVRLASLVDGTSPQEVCLDVRRTLAGVLPDAELNQVCRVFHDVQQLFEGSFPGYRGCNTRYHDLEHTTDTLLAMARLIRGAAEEGVSIDPRTAQVGLAAALLHDTGYIQRNGDRGGTGAKYTASHIRRSIDFAREYLPTRGYSRADYETCRNALHCTGLDVHIEKIRFRTDDDARIGKMLGAADLIGQMASCRYAENLLHLYDEFREGGLPVPRSAYGFLANTPRFYRMVLDRFAFQLDGVHHYATSFFRADLGIDRNLYMEAIEANIARLESILKRQRRDYRDVLRRDLRLMRGSRGQGPGDAPAADPVSTISIRPVSA